MGMCLCVGMWGVYGCVFRVVGCLCGVVVCGAVRVCGGGFGCVWRVRVWGYVSVCCNRFANFFLIVLRLQFSL